MSILDDEDILIASAKECTTNPMIILKNRVSNRGRFVKEDILILNEIIEDFNKNNPKYGWLASKIKFDIVGNCSICNCYFVECNLVNTVITPYVWLT